jgi:Mg-chelatase subunit ChlD
MACWVKRAWLAALLCVVAASAALAETNVLFIFDASGSMKTRLPGSSDTRLSSAKRAMAQTLKELPSDVRLGLMLYGHRRAKDCTDIELVSPIGADDAAAIAKRIQGLAAKGETPIADALLQAVRNFKAFPGQSNRIVLITDGIEECHGDPCAAAQAVADAGLDLKVDIVGFTLNAQQRKAIECIVDKTGGHYYDAQDVRSLNAALSQVKQVVAAAPAATPPAPPKPQEFDLLAQKNGGEVLAAPSDLWTGTNDGKEQEHYWFRLGEEGVYGFKDGRPGTFSKFAVLIPRTADWNPKEIELLVGDEGPTGQFRSLGTFTTQNIKLMKSPYQEFTFPEVTAKYLKVKLVSNYGNGNGVELWQLRLPGKLAEASAATAPQAAPAAGEIDLLAQKNGGEVLAAPTDLWPFTNSGKEQEIYWFRLGEEGVFGFKDGRPGTFSKFAVLIPRTADWNPKEIELLVGDEGPTGQFRSLGTFTTQNIKLMKSPYQEFTFPEVTTKYVKVKLVSNYGNGNGVELWQLRLPGKLAEASAATAPQVAAPAAGEIDLLAQKNGGEVLAAPTDLWAGVNDGKEQEIYWFRLGEEGVFGFKDGRPGTFSKFAVLIPRTADWNPKEIELLVGDEGPTGAFRSLGTFTTQNVKLMKSPYQAFAFPEVTAKYLKVKLISNYGNGNGVELWQLRLPGKLAEASAATAPQAAAAAGEIDLLAEKNGGEVLAAPTDLWAGTNDGKEQEHYWFRLGEEAVYGFKDGRPGTFSRFAVLISRTADWNPKEIELLVGDEGPTGAFRSLGTFTTQNVKLMKSPYQAFAFPEVTAKYLKVKLISNYGNGNGVELWQLRLPGKLAEGTAATVPQATAAAGEIDLLAQKNGGEVLAAPTDLWTGTNDGKEQEHYWFRLNEEAVYGFKDGRPGTFSRFAVLIPQTADWNPKEIELLVGDEGPTGAFRSLGTFTTQNVKLMRSPYQAFAFPEVTAKYLKVKLISNYGNGNGVELWQLRLPGKLQP